jgi:integrase
MYIVKKHTDDSDKTRNFYDMETNKFIFNQYKTKKTYNQQYIDVPPELKDVLQLFISHYPLNIGKKADFKLLVASDGAPLTTVNAITRILNKIFGKRVGSTMLRHSYLTTKYGDQIDEQRKDALGMGHSINTQRDYIRTKE